MDYTPAEYCDMLLIYGEYRQNARRAAQEYGIRFPERRRPDKNIFLRLVNRIRETGSVILNRKDAVMERTARTVENEEAVLLNVEETPETSIRIISNHLNLSKSSVQRILNEHRLHAYRFTKVQNLLPRDYQSRLTFCTWILEQENNQRGFIRNILFTDESCFTREGSFNTHNTHLWANENPHGFHIRNFQERFNINLWAGIIDNKIVSHITFRFLIY